MQKTKLGPRKKPNRYLCVVLDERPYAIDILRIQEIQGYTKPDLVPCMPNYLRGVVNVHGAIIPVIDLRLRFGLAEKQPDRTTVTVFVKIGHRTVGLVVDTASSVLDVMPEQIKPAPEFGLDVDRSFIAGMVHHNNQLLVLLELDQLFGQDRALSLVAEDQAQGLGEGV